MATIAWQSDVGADRCRLAGHDDGFSLSGEAILAESSIPYLVTYRVGVDLDWQTRDVFVRVFGDHSEATVHFVAGGGTWTLGGKALASLDGCIDVDLAFTPATNTLPVRRLGLGVGDAADVAAAWMRWPELDVVRAEQRYERLAEDRYRFTQEDFSAEIAVDSEGLVLAYADIWRVIGRA
jgi:hypothetical protein